MKGISTILATILIVIIVVALVSLTYTFAMNLFSTASRGTTSGVEQTTIRLDKAVAFAIDPDCEWSSSDSNYQLKFAIRHLGATYSINRTEISVFWGRDEFTITEDSWPFDELLNPGEVKSIVATNKTEISSGTKDVTVSAPAASITKTNVKCSAS